ncbi:mechanosensitive ion channel family protein [Arenicella xantha]|nr:mechanosensitive ion channel domain-containing protein [Arenicella xantha]
MNSTLSAVLNAFTIQDLITIGISLLLMILARPFSKWLNSEDDLTSRVSMMRMLNFLIIVAVLASVFVLHESAWLSRLTQSLIVIYFATLVTHVINYFVRRRFGKTRITSTGTSISDTYSSRGLSLAVAAFISVIALVTCLRILGLNSLLEAGGALGIIGLFLAMTQGSWAPDIISGLIILNSRLCEEGDVVQFNMDGTQIVASVFKTKLFHTECLDLANNHRLMVRNTKLRDYGIQNLSRFASAKGLRECMLFNIDYAHSQNEVTEMMLRAFSEIDRVEGMREEQFDPEVLVHDTGDYAVTWAVYYYIKDVKHLLKIKQKFRAHILAESVRSDISLATPVLQMNEVTLSKAAANVTPSM